MKKVIAGLTAPIFLAFSMEPEQAISQFQKKLSKANTEEVGYCVSVYEIVYYCYSVAGILNKMNCKQLAKSREVYRAMPVETGAYLPPMNVRASFFEDYCEQGCTIRRQRKPLHVIDYMIDCLGKQ